MKKIYVVHRWEGNPDADWYPWFKKQYEGKYDVEILSMPNPKTPKIEEWVNHLRNSIKELNEETILIGHSIGCQTILRYLETLPDETKVAKVILVTPWVTLSKKATDGVEEVARPWLETPIDWRRAKSHSSKFVAIFSDDDYYVDLKENKKIFEKKLGAEIIIEHNKGHMTQYDKVTELPILRKLL